MQWYYAINGQRQGPVTEAEFERLVREGTVRSDTLVWRQGMANWLPFGEVAPTLPPVTPGVPPVVAAPVEAAGTRPLEDDTAICAVSGKRYPKREMVEYEGKWISAEHRDTYFQRLREGVAPIESRQYAGFWIRFLAKIIDGLILFVVNTLMNLPLGVGLFADTPVMDGSDPSALFALLARQGLAMLANTAFGLLFTWFFLSRYSATPGKLALGLKIVRSDGSKLGTGRIIGRFFAEWVSAIIIYIGYIMAGFDEEKRALHDHICDTRVIKTR